MVYLKNFHKDIREISDSAQTNTAGSQKNKFSKIQNWLTKGVLQYIFCAKSINNISENPEVANAARSFTGINFVFAGLSLP